MVAGVLLLATVWVFLLRYVPDQALLRPTGVNVPVDGVFPVRSELLRAFAPRAAAVLGFLLAFGVVGGWILAGRMLAPLTQITTAAREAGLGSLTHRIRLHGRNDEFRELADAFDSMLDQLEAHVAEQQRFASNASHELRTPLAISRTLLDVARKDPARGRDELIERLHAANKRAIELTEALLVLGRGERGNVAREKVDLSLVAEETAETLLPLAEQRRVTLTVTGDAAPVAGDAELLGRMITNLVQNAIVHNLPAGGRVTIHTGEGDFATVLRVENTGPRLAPEQLPRLLEPFHRGTQRVRTDEHVGAGLGLAIVHSIVRAHQGTIHLTPIRSGGLVVTVRLPPA
ncbi:HAMP domain-containing histidine kinase [Actinoplanes sp. LDG1-01]|uniref:histidine kinase n=2 Tax=Paractinoplanes lichenicola TaxID=2802976 RepID=A0ABS1VUZ9_9ACTN|nr:HAMP domain-containing histidine kinase [Actinoplanes lichenicola]